MVKGEWHGRAHDYVFLIQRWRKLARRAGLRMIKYAEAGGYELFYLESIQPENGAPAIYLSAGIHGDEAGATEGLWAWAETNAERIRGLKMMIFPCLNPWGLVNNSRFDAEGRDLNRAYRYDKVSQLAAQLRRMEGRRFQLALTLHEDYDGQGNYIYEVSARRPYWGEQILAAEKHIPVDRRRRIDGRPARAGVLRTKLSPDLMPDWPEAFALHFSYADRTLTLETPSEFSISARAQAHRKMIARAVELAKAEAKTMRRFDPSSMNL